MITFQLNGRIVSVHSPEDAPLLWVIRDELGLTGTKFGCGIGFCGACSVHCQSGQIMQAATLLKDYPDPTDRDINAVMAGSVCRCMAYIRIKKAIKLAATRMRGGVTHG